MYRGCVVLHPWRTPPLLTLTSVGVATGWAATAPIAHRHASGLAQLKWPIRVSGLRRVNRSALAWIALCALFAGVVSWSIDARVTELMLNQVTVRAMDQVELGVSQQVLASDFEAPHTPQKLQILAARLDPLLGRIREQGSGVLRVNVFARDGTVVYSDVASLRGLVVPPLADPLLADALAGAARAEISSLSRPESVDLKPRYDQALEAYVPLTVAGQVVGAYELYQDLAPLERVHPVWVLLSAGLGLTGVVVALGLLALKARTRESRRSASAALAWPVSHAAHEVLAYKLTRRETEVLRLLAGDRTYRGIARELVVSEETVRTHVKSILHKLNQPDRHGAVRVAVTAGIVHSRRNRSAG